MTRTRVLVVDDSAVMRQLLAEILSQDPSLEVVGVASDPYVARDKIRALSPDVLTLDVEMPRMDGLTFLEKLMRAHPMPVVMVSSLTERGADTTLRALELGAVDFVTKPRLDVRSGTLEQAERIREKVRAAARVHVRRPSVDPAPPRLVTHALLKSTHRVLALGASTGGTEALRALLQPLPPDSPGIVIVQHMPAGFTRAFAGRLDQCCALNVKEAADGDRVLPGHALLAPGNFQLRIERSGATYVARVTSEPPVNRHRPSVDVLFDSVADQVGGNALGVLLTGMGDDGARGLLAMRKAGARTFAQDEASCIVFGMPREAIRMGAAEQVVSLADLPAAVLRAAA